MSSEDIASTHDTFMTSLGIELSDDNKRLPYLYWTPKLHKSPVKKKLGLDNCSTPTGNLTYTSGQMLSEDIASTHDTFMTSLGIELSDDNKRLPYLYWTPKLHKSPVKHRFIACSSICTTKQLSSLLTKILNSNKDWTRKILWCKDKPTH